MATTGGAPAALWGEFCSTAALARRARGAVVDGLMRCDPHLPPRRAGVGLTKW